MAQLILPPQKFRFRDITDQFPAGGNPKKKVFFQAEIRSVTGSNATFGIIAYPSWKDGKNWVIGTKVIGIDTGGAPVTMNLNTHVAFANNEVLLSAGTKKKKNKKKKEPKKGRWSSFEKMVKKSCKDPKQLESAELIFNSRISANPHLEYDVTMDFGTSTLMVSTNPSPPAPPEA
jgi:hypothetical protein